MSDLDRDASMANLQAAEQDSEDDEESLWKLAWNGFRRGFTLTYFVRAGESIASMTMSLEEWLHVRSHFEAYVYRNLKQMS